MSYYVNTEKQKSMVINNKKSVIFDIITVPNKILRKKSKKVNINLIKKDEFLDFVLSLIKTMDYYDGVGLSAIQVGFDMRLFIIRKDLDNREEIQKERKEIDSIDDIELFINPEIIEYSKEVNEDWEGCLSIPNVSALIKRSNSIKIKFIDLNGNEVLNSYQGFKARVIQHEYDHLNGILILDKAIKIERE